MTSAVIACSRPARHPPASLVDKGGFGVIMPSMLTAETAGAHNKISVVAVRILLAIIPKATAVAALSLCAALTVQVSAQEATLVVETQTVTQTVTQVVTQTVTKTVTQTVTQTVAPRVEIDAELMKEAMRNKKIYKVRVQRVGKDIYQVVGRNTFVKTWFCHDYGSHSEVLLEVILYKGFQSGEMHFLNGLGRECRIKEILGDSLPHTKSL